MASNIVETGGYNYRFVDDDPPTKYICHICTFVARTPQQVSCCGYVFCESCLKELKSKGQQFICPICRRNLKNKYFNDRRADLEIRSLQIYCTNKKESNDDITCQWKGNLKDIEDHFKVCPYQLVACSNKCGEQHQRQILQHHLDNECFKRQVKCEYCEAVETFEEMFGNHIEECPNYLIFCDNEGCNEVMKRHLMEDHNNICPKQVISCQYNSIGCDVKMKREDQEKHEEHDMKKHLEMSIQMTKEAQDKIKDLQSTISHCIKHIDSSNYTSCRVIKFAEFEDRKDGDENWYSPGFYTSPGGYKMSLHIYPNGSGDGEDTHVSIFVCLMSGKYDDALEWPFQGEITVELLNQLEDNNHKKRVIKFNEYTPLSSTQRVMEKQYGNGRGYHKFISHPDLIFVSFQNCQYLKDDALYFRVSVTTTFIKPWLATITTSS